MAGWPTWSAGEHLRLMDRARGNRDAVDFLTRYPLWR
jgi:hypothetical protein